jgi:hypothetical protein
MIVNSPATLRVQARLQEDGLGGLADLLHRHGMGIAGSYVLPNHTADPSSLPDVDVWIPGGTPQRPAVADVAALLHRLGYPFPRTCRPSGSHYSRFNTVIDTLHSFHCPGKRSVQLLSTKPAAATSMAQIVAGFDLIVLQQYYDGRTCVGTDAARVDSDSMSIGLNTADPKVRHQSLPEWVRTALRIRKYQNRGFRLRSTVEHSLTRAITDCLRTLPMTSCMASVAVQYEDSIHAWNSAMRGLRWDEDGAGPQVSLVDGGEGGTVGSMRWHVRTRGGGVATVPVTCPDALLGGTTVRWRGATRLVAALTPFPTLCAVQRGSLVALDETVVFDHLRAEDTRCGEFVDRDPENNVVVFVETCPNTITRQQLDCAPRYAPFRSSPGPCEDRPSVIAIQIPSGNFYVPVSQVHELLHTVGSGVVQLVSSGRWWERARGTGGAADRRGCECIPIHFFRRVPRHGTDNAVVPATP